MSFEWPLVTSYSGMYRLDGYLSAYAIRIKDGFVEDRGRLEVRARLSAAHASKGLSESATLWMDGVQLTDETGSREMACMDPSRLDFLARQRRRSATDTT